MAKAIEPALTAQIQKLLAESGTSALELMEAFGIQGVAKGAEKRVTRRAARETWLSPEKTQMDEDETLAVKRLPEVIGQGIRLQGPGELSQQQVDSLADELKTVRSVQNILNGVHDAIKQTAFNALDAKVGIEEKGALYSTTHQYKLERIVKGGTAEPDLNKLEEILDEETWKKISTPVKTRTLDPTKLEKEMKKGNVTLEHLSKCVKEVKKTQVFTPKDLKPGEVVN